jgi:hypothetical protein
MARVSRLLCAVTLLAIGCRLPPEREALRALPESRLFSYDELLHRARAQATAAVEAFYVDGWRDLEDAAAALEQTSRFLPKTSNIPASMQTKLDSEADALRREAVQLGDAARARQVQRTNEALQRLNLRIRELLPKEGPSPEILPAAGRIPDRPPRVEVSPEPAAVGPAPTTPPLPVQPEKSSLPPPMPPS